MNAQRPPERRGDDEERLLDHDYDGIREYDNPLPRWWVTIFWLTVIWAVVYFVNLVPGIGTGAGRIATYEREMKIAEERRAALEAKAGPFTEERLMAMAADPARLATGKEKYAQLCTPCHRADGGGGIGPNLTDEYWLHGGRVIEVMTTVSQGVAEKGMPAWSQVMGRDELAAVVAYVTTLRGTKPPDAKAPQGEKVVAGTAAADSQAARASASVP